MRVQPCQRQTGHQHGPQRLDRAPLDHQNRPATPSRQQRARAIDDQEQRPAPAHHRLDPGCRLRQTAKARHACGNQRRIAQRTGQADCKDMAATQALPEDKGILRPDRKDQRQPQPKARTHRLHRRPPALVRNAGYPPPVTGSIRARCFFLLQISAARRRPKTQGQRFRMPGRFSPWSRAQSSAMS